MSCECCRCVVGNVYTFLSASCDECGTYIPPKKGSYLGMHGNLHMFRVHPKFICPNCSLELGLASFVCSDFDGVDVTEEFQGIRVHSKSHWIGKSPDA
jgi:hypothetical protein